jgi:hypothetical protein
VGTAGKGCVTAGIALAVGAEVPKNSPWTISTVPTAAVQGAGFGSSGFSGKYTLAASNACNTCSPFSTSSGFIKSISSLTIFSLLFERDSNILILVLFVKYYF